MQKGKKIGPDNIVGYVGISGRKETINGVTSNWVLINFVGDAYNTDGKKIYYKTEGWLFGGILD